MDQRIGDFYASCMDESGVEAQGLRPLQAALAPVEALTREGLPRTLGALGASGVDAALSLDSIQDLADAGQVVAQADQGGLGLPDPTLYLRQDPDAAALRDAYLKHVARMLQLGGRSAAEAAAAARRAVDFEVALASASQPPLLRQDPANVDHKMTVEELARLAPGFDWAAYFEASGAPKFGSLNVASPAFMTAVAQLARAEPLRSWKDYLAWRLIHARAALLPKAFVDEDFAFYGRSLAGERQPRPRWSRCVGLTDRLLADDLGRRYVERSFGPEAKKRALAMAEALKAAFARDAETRPWLSEKTRALAAEKLRAVTARIGYPDAWRDDSALTVARGELLDDAARAERLERKRRLDRIGKPLDRREWDVTAPSGFHFYDQRSNSINFPAGSLQPPLFDDALDDAVNFGASGALMAHELTHAVDIQGRMFDANGDLKDWWTTEDALSYEAHGQCLEEQYSRYPADDGGQVDGARTLYENVADNSGLRVALMALNAAQGGGESKTRKDGFTAHQRFFLAWGQMWCVKNTDEDARIRARADPHAPGRYRVNGAVRNMPSFAKAFSCKKGAPLAPAVSDACRVW